MKTVIFVLFLRVYPMLESLDSLVFKFCISVFFEYVYNGDNFFSDYSDGLATLNACKRKNYRKLHKHKWGK